MNTAGISFDKGSNMAMAADSRQRAWEYRRVYVISSHGGADPADWGEDPGRCVDNLVAAIDRLDAGAEAGWMLASIRIEEDATGHRWLSALMKRPLLEAGEDRPVIATLHPAQGGLHRAA